MRNSIARCLGIGQQCRLILFICFRTKTRFHDHVWRAIAGSFFPMGVCISRALVCLPWNYFHHLGPSSILFSLTGQLIELSSLFDSNWKRVDVLICVKGFAYLRIKYLNLPLTEVELPYFCVPGRKFTSSRKLNHNLIRNNTLLVQYLIMQAI